jgi:hypothetical protein
MWGNPETGRLGVHRGVSGFPHGFDLDFELDRYVDFDFDLDFDLDFCGGMESERVPDLAASVRGEVRDTGDGTDPPPPQVGRGSRTRQHVQCAHELELMRVAAVCLRFNVCAVSDMTR